MISILDPQAQTHSNPDNNGKKLQKVSPFNTIVLNGMQYSLDNMDPAELFTSDITYSFNEEQKSLPDMKIYTKDFVDQTLLASYNNDDQLQKVTLVNKAEGKILAHLESLRSDTFLAEVDEESALKLNQDLDRRLRGSSRTTVEETKISIPCSELDVASVAISYDDSFCADKGGEFRSISDTMYYMALVSIKHERYGVCTTIKVSDLSGSCGDEFI